MDKKSFLRSIKNIYEYIVAETTVKDLINPFNDALIRDFFINNHIDVFKNSIAESFEIINDLLVEMVNNQAEIYPVVNKLQEDIFILDKEKNDVFTMDDSDFVEVAKFNSVLSLFLCSISLILNPLNDYRELRNKFVNEKNLYFRGQADSSYGLLPSFYRDLSINDDEITIKTVEEKYKEHGFYQRYKSIFSAKYKSIKTNYIMMSYVQHCAAYSPLLDLTKSIDVAAFFACTGKNINPNTYTKNDSAIFIFQLLKEYHKKNAKLKIKWVDTKVSFNSVLVEDKFLFECSPKDFFISYSLMNQSTNDRMNYQNGSFLFIEEGIIINKHLLIPVDQILIVKVVIPANMKKDIYSYVVDVNETLSEDYVYDPYSYLSNYAKK